MSDASQPGCFRIPLSPQKSASASTTAVIRVSPFFLFSVEALFPRPEIQPAFRHRNDHLASHDLALHMRVGIVLSGVVVPVLAHRFMRCYLLWSGIVIMLQLRFIVVDEHRSGNVHGVYDAFTITTTSCGLPW